MSGLPSWFKSVMRQISRPSFDTFLMSGLPSLLASSISTLLPDSLHASCSMTCERTPSGSFAFATPEFESEPQPAAPVTASVPIPARESVKAPTFRKP